MYVYEVISVCPFGLHSRLGWVESYQPMTLSQAARALMMFDDTLARATDASMKAEISGAGPEFACWICKRKGYESLAVLQWPAERYSVAKRDYHKVEIVNNLDWQSLDTSHD